VVKLWENKRFLRTYVFARQEYIYIHADRRYFHEEIGDIRISINNVRIDKKLLGMGYKYD